MSDQIFQIFSSGMRFWFILLIGGMLVALAIISFREYKDRRVVLADVSRYVGYLEVLEGPEGMYGSRVGLTHDNSIGSGATCEICFRDPGVEKYHAELTMKEDYMILYPAAKAIIKLNGARVRGVTEVYNGDILTFGSIETLLFIRQEDTDED